MKKIILSIGGMSCSACSVGLEKYLRKQPGILEASVNLVLAQAMITYEDSLTIEDLNRFVEEAGFESLGEFHDFSKQKESIWPVILYGVLVLILMYISMGKMLSLPMIPMTHKMHGTVLLLLTIPFLIYARDIIKSGIKNLLHKSPNMDTLVSLGVFASFGYSIYLFVLTILDKGSYHFYFESVAMILYFVKLGRFIDRKSKDKTKEAIQELVQITPTKALLKREGNEIEVTIDEVQKGDILIAKPGMKIAVDGTITKGSSHLEEAFITGESTPVKKKEGSEVIAGSMNIDGYLEYEAKRIGKDSTISEIVRLVVEATNTKAPIAQLADKISSYFVPTIFLLALGTFLFYLIIGQEVGSSLERFVTVLVVACPCALGLSTPLSMVVSIGNSAKKGILIKKNEVLERVAKVTTVIFDKTGTLTYGKLKVDKVFSKMEEDQLLSIVASLEATSTHPIAQAFASYEKVGEGKEIENLPGMGMRGTLNGKNYTIGNRKILEGLSNPYEKEEEQLASLGDSILYVVLEKQVIGLIGVKDMPRENVKDVIRKLEEKSIQVVMLTGDHQKAASVIAKELGISQVVAEVLPKDKQKEIERRISEGEVVMMVGDGINDAPSLALADIGVSVMSGTDIATDSADVILMNDNLDLLTSLFTISKKTIRNIQENLFWAFFYNVVMIVLAMGFFEPKISLNPMLASLAMTISSLTVVLNALRLRRI